MAPVDRHPTPRPHRRARSDGGNQLRYCQSAPTMLAARSSAPILVLRLASSQFAFQMSLSARGDFRPGRFLVFACVFPTARPISKQRRGVHIGGLYQPPKEKTWLSER